MTRRRASPAAGSWPASGTWKRARITAATAVVAVCGLIGAGVGRSADEPPVDESSDGVPASLRKPESFWPNRLVVQTRGWVLARGDDDHIIRKEYWTLGPAAIGRVTAVRADGMAIVEFENANGWERHGFEEREVRSQRWDAELDQYGRPVAIRMRESVREGIQVEPGDHGHLVEVDDGGKRRTVRFPLNCLGLAPPQPGMRVVPGPDLEPSEARRLARDVGTVVGHRDADHYVRVRWASTGREKFYRFDRRRFYDVVPAAAVNDDPTPR